MPVLQLEKMTTHEFADLSRDRTIIVIPVGPLEEHSDHLPLGTDAITATFLGEQFAKDATGQNHNLNVVLHPTLFLGTSTLTLPGSIEVRAHALHAVLWDVTSSLAKFGFRKIILFGAHGGPRHMVVLEEIAAKLRWRYNARAISATAKYLLEMVQGSFKDKILEQIPTEALNELKNAFGQNFEGGFVSDYHAGLIETSFVMAIDRSLVRDSYQSGVDLKIPIYKMSRSAPRRFPEGRGHFGNPRFANVHVGNAIIEIYRRELVPKLLEYMTAEKLPKALLKEFRSKLYFVPFFRTHFNLVASLLVSALLLWFAVQLVTRLLGV